ncbi:Uncharacterised protein r2_g2398 [Pycnogonum litorale]
MSKDLCQAPFYSIITDGTTDASVSEAEIMYVRYCCKGKIATRFLALRNVAKANSENLTTIIEDTVKEIGGITDANLYAKLVGFGADGASVNMGRQSGIAARLKTKQPLITSVHCMAHRLELSFKDVICEDSRLQNVITLLENLCKFYHKSSLNRSMFKELRTRHGITGGIPTRLGGTRWIPHTFTALQNFWKLYPALVQHLKEVEENSKSVAAKCKARSYRKQITRPSFIRDAAVTTDICLYLKQLSLFIQKRNANIAEVQEVLQTTMEVLRKLADRNGPKLSELLEGSFHGIALDPGNGFM